MATIMRRLIRPCEKADRQPALTAGGDAGAQSDARTSNGSGTQIARYNSEASHAMGFRASGYHPAQSFTESRTANEVLRQIDAHHER